MTFRFEELIEGPGKGVLYEKLYKLIPVFPEILPITFYATADDDGVVEEGDQFVYFTQRDGEIYCYDPVYYRREGLQLTTVELILVGHEGYFRYGNPSQWYTAEELFPVQWMEHLL